MLRDRLLAHPAAQGVTPDYSRLAAEVLGIRGAPPALARTLVDQALIMEDPREHWQRVGERARREAPAAPGVYVFRDWAGSVLYVGKAVNLRRRLGAHFADRRWLSLPPAMARVAAIEWQPVGSEIEALLREASLIRELRPTVNVQRDRSTLATRAIPRTLLRDVALLVPSMDPGAVEIVAARSSGSTLLVRAARDAAEIVHHARQIWTFFHRAANPEGDGSAALVFSWLAGRGQQTTRIDPHDSATAADFGAHLRRLLADPHLFSERLVVV